MKILLTFFQIFIVIQNLYAADPVQGLSKKDLDGLYYVTPDDSLVDYLVLSHDGKSIPQKPDDPDAPTNPGLYYKDVRFKIKSFKLNKSDLSFETDIVGSIQFRFKGHVQQRSEPEFHAPLHSLHGILEMIDKDHGTKRHNIVFEKGVVY